MMPFEIKNKEQFYLGTGCTLTGLIGTVFLVKSVKELLTQWNQERMYKQNIESKGAKILEWYKDYGNTREYCTKLEIPLEKCTDQDRLVINHNWHQLTQVKSEQQFTEFILSWSFAFTCLLLIGPSVMYNQISSHKN